MDNEYEGKLLYGGKVMNQAEIVDDKGQPVLVKPQASVDKKQACFFTAANASHIKYAVTFWKSMVKFHDPKEIDMLFYTDVTDKTELDKLPKGIQVVDLTPYLEDKMFWYRQKPILSEPLLDFYELVVGFDSDQIVLDKLTDVLNIKTYDVGVVINWNRHDEKFYPVVEMMRIGVQPIEYFNCGLVALRSKKFCHNWLIWCYSQNFDRCQYKEQDGLNILCHSGNWNVWCFDMPASKDAPVHWYGIISKGELSRAEIKDGRVFIGKGFGSTPFPPSDVWVHLIHMGGGSGAPKDNWNMLCSPELMKYIEEVTK